MERKVGEVFNDGDVTLKVVECENCNGCFFYNNICTRWGVHLKNCGECHHSHRSDIKSVKFIKIGESKMDNREELKRSLAEEEQRAKNSLANIEKMKKQLEELNKKQEQPTVSATGVYLGEQNNERYFTIFGNNIVEEEFCNSGTEKKRFELNNCFTTKEQSEQEALRREGQEFIRRCAMLWNNDHDWRKDFSKNQYNIFYGMTNGLIVGDYNCIGDSCPYFDSKELAEKCIKKLKEKYNEEQIKTIFGVK